MSLRAHRLGHPSSRSRVALLLVTTGLLCHFAGTVRAAELPRVFDLGKPDGSLASYSIALTANGRVIGLGRFRRSDFSEYERAFSWTASGGMVDLGTLGGDFVVVNAVSSSGQVVGWSTASGNYPGRAFSWTPDGGMVNLGTLGGATSYALAVSSAGHVVGQSQTTSGEYHAFLWTKSGGMVDLGGLSGGYSTPRAVNDAGQVVGESRLANGRHHAFSWTSSGGMIDLDHGNEGVISSAAAVNADGQVAGIRTTFGPSPGSFSNAAFSWTATGGRIDMDPLPGGSHSQPLTLSANGLVIGWATTSDGYHAFAWTPAEAPVDLGTLGGKYSMPSAVNASGQVIGQADTTENNASHAFSWTEADGMVDLGTLSDATFSFPIAVNDSGQVVGYSGNWTNSEYRPFSWTRAGGMVELETLGGKYSSANAVNAKGQVAGQSQTPNYASTHAVFWATSQEDPVSLILAVQTLLASGELGSGNANSLIKKVEGAIQQLDTGSVGPAVNKLEAFINEVEALIRSGKLAAASGQPLIDEARLIIDALT